MTQSLRLGVLALEILHQVEVRGGHIPCREGYCIAVGRPGEIRHFGIQSCFHLDRLTALNGDSPDPTIAGIGNLVPVRRPGQLPMRMDFINLDYSSAWPSFRRDKIDRLLLGEIRNVLSIRGPIDGSPCNFIRVRSNLPGLAPIGGDGEDIDFMRFVLAPLNISDKTSSSSDSVSFGR